MRKCNSSIVFDLNKKIDDNDDNCDSDDILPSLNFQGINRQIYYDQDRGKFCEEIRLPNAAMAFKQRSFAIFKGIRDLII